MGTGVSVVRQEKTQESYDSFFDQFGDFLKDFFKRLIDGNPAEADFECIDCGKAMKGSEIKNGACSCGSQNIIPKDFKP